MAVGSLLRVLSSAAPSVSALRPINRLPITSAPIAQNTSQYSKISDELGELAKKAYPDLPQQELNRAASRVINRNPAPFRDTDFIGDFGNDYRVINQHNTLALRQMLEDIGAEFGVSSSQARPMFSPSLAARRFDDLDLTINMPMQAFEGIGSAGRMRSAEELGRSTSLGLLSPGQRFRDIEAPVFGVTNPNLRPFYGWLSRRPGTAPMPWETGGWRGRQTGSSGRIYGEVGARFGPSVRNDSSFFIGDSLNTARGVAVGGRSGVGRRLTNMTPDDVRYAGIQRLPDASYIETQTWRPPRLNEITGVDAPEYLVPQIEDILRRNRMQVPIYTY
jgi:hypothetical protein